jgi:hypothetical protein
MVIAECILGGIALELFMKGILKSYNPNVRFKEYGHKLDKLYFDLDDMIKSNIFKKVEEMYEYNNIKLHDEIHLNILIENHRDIFIAMRYLFEDEYYSQTKNFSPFFLYALTTSFYNYVAELATASNNA